jgi:hypothetical protein
VSGIAFWWNGAVVRLSQREKRVTNMVSTVHSTEMVEVIQIKQNKFKPKCTVHCNTFMHSMDYADQYLKMYPFTRRTLK